MNSDTEMQEDEARESGGFEHIEAPVFHARGFQERGDGPRPLVARMAEDQDRRRGGGGSPLFRRGHEAPSAPSRAEAGRASSLGREK
jgi:hypothetical protein